MAGENFTRSRGWLYTLGAVLVLGVLWGITQGRSRRAPEPIPASTAIAPTGDISATIPAPSTNLGLSMVGPGVAELIQLMQQWRLLHPTYHMVVETTGPDLAATTEVFRFVTEQGIVVSRARSDIRQPNSAAYVLETIGENARAYFPDSNELINIDVVQEAASSLAQTGFVGSLSDATALVRLARASFVEAGPDYRALTFVFPGTVFQMPRAAGELFLTIHVDDSGKAISLEQLTLGMRVASKLTYLDDAPGVIQEKSPKIPATAVLTKKSFREALQERAKPSKSSPPKGVLI